MLLRPVLRNAQHRADRLMGRKLMKMQDMRPRPPGEESAQVALKDLSQDVASAVAVGVVQRQDALPPYELNVQQKVYMWLSG